MYDRKVYNKFSSMLLPKCVKDEARFNLEQEIKQMKIEDNIDCCENSSYAFAYIDSYEGIQYLRDFTRQLSKK